MNMCTLQFHLYNSHTHYIVSESVEVTGNNPLTLLLTPWTSVLLVVLPLLGVSLAWFL